MKRAQPCTCCGVTLAPGDTARRVYIGALTMREAAEHGRRGAARYAHPECWERRGFPHPLTRDAVETLAEQAQLRRAAGLPG